jgi:hypothetical protein
MGGGAAGLLGMLGGDDRDRLAEVAHLLHGEDWLVGDLEPVALVTGDVLVREDGADAGHAARLGCVDRGDAGPRVRAAKGVPVEHAGREEIARVGELARHLGDRVGAADRLADAPVLELAGGGAHVRLARSRRIPSPTVALGRVNLESGRRQGVAPHAPAAMRTASKIFW